MGGASICTPYGHLNEAKPELAGLNTTPMERSRSGMSPGRPVTFHHRSYMKQPMVSPPPPHTRPPSLTPDRHPPSSKRATADPSNTTIFFTFGDLKLASLAIGVVVGAVNGYVGAGCKCCGWVGTQRLSDGGRSFMYLRCKGLKHAHVWFQMAGAPLLHNEARPRPQFVVLTD